MTLRMSGGRSRTGRLRWTAIAAVATAVVVALTGCGAGGSAPSASSGKVKSLTVLVEAGGHGELQPIADAYLKQTGTKVTFVELPYNGLYDRVNSELSSGSVSFDVAALDAIWLPAFAPGLSPLDSMFTSSVTSDLFPATLAEGKVGGHYVGMPAFVNSEILYYRKDLFDSAANKAAFKAKYGYDLTPPTTWQQYADAAAFFTKNGMYGTAVKGDVETEYLATLMQAGEKNMVLDSKGNVTLGDAASLKALNYYTSLSKDSPSGESQIDWAAAQNLFNQGKTAMMLFWGHAYRQIPTNSPVYGKVGAAPMIAGPAGIAGIPGPFYLSIPKAGKNQQAAADFVRFAYQHNSLSAGTALGLVARISALKQYENKPGYAAYQPMITTLSAPATQSRPETPKWQQIVDSALIPMIQKAVQPGANNQQLLDAAKQKIQSILQ
jgi:ABC-type glycerol-3-phosphate transport system substrate-binding protein